MGNVTLGREQEGTGFGSSPVADCGINGVGTSIPKLVLYQSSQFWISLTDHSLPTNAEVRECVEISLLPQYAFMAWCSVTLRDWFSLRIKNSLCVYFSTMKDRQCARVRS